MGPEFIVRGSVVDNSESGPWGLGGRVVSTARIPHVFLFYSTMGRAGSRVKYVQKILDVRRFRNSWYEARGTETGAKCTLCLRCRVGARARHTPKRNGKGRVINIEVHFASVSVMNIVLVYMRWACSGREVNVR